MIYSFFNRYKIDLPQIPFFDNTFNIGYNETKNKEFKQELINFIELSKDRKVFFDIGSYIGLFSLIFSADNYENEKKQSHMFEPSDIMHSVFDFIKNNTEDQRIKNNIILNKNFVGEENRFVPYKKHNKDAPEMFFVGTEEIKNKKSFFSKKIEKEQTIEMISIDDYCEKLNVYPDTIKIDVEGYEINTLCGMQKTINKNKPLIFMEVHPEYMKYYNNEIIQVYDFFTSNNYNIFDVFRKQLETKEEFYNYFKQGDNFTKPFIMSNKEEKII